MQTARRRCLARNDPAIKRMSGSIDRPELSGFPGYHEQT
jgi:hypothetical protein